MSEIPLYLSRALHAGNRQRESNERLTDPSNLPRQKTSKRERQAPHTPPRSLAGQDARGIPYTLHPITYTLQTCVGSSAVENVEEKATSATLSLSLSPGFRAKCFVFRVCVEGSVASDW